MTEVSRTVAKSILKKIGTGMPAEEIATELEVSKLIVTKLIHRQVLADSDEMKLERLQELAGTNTTISGSNIDIKEQAAKQLSKWLFQAGMIPGQVHLCTGISIHKARHIYKQTKSALDMSSAVIPMPQSLPSRIVMSIFSTHYTYLMEQTETTSVQVTNVIVAWSRTIEEVRNLNIDKLEGFDPRLLSLGSLFEVARSFREVKAPSPENASSTPWKKTRKLERDLCPTCLSHFVYFSGSRRVKNSQCCYCEVNKLIDKKKL